MSVSGLCERCTHEVHDSCDRCASLVCYRHYDEASGYCTDCAAEVGLGGRDRPDNDPDGPDGTDTYRF